MNFKRRTLREIAELICGSIDDTSVFRYRSSSYLTEFFADAETDHEVGGSTRDRRVANTLQAILAESHSDPRSPPDAFLRVIEVLMDQGDARNEGADRPKALEMLNAALAREGLEAFYGDDRICRLRHSGTTQALVPQANPQRSLSPEEMERRERLEEFMKACSEDQLIEDVLVPLFRQLGFDRIEVGGHKDKSLEYGKDLWMRHVLPTRHVLYFGLQAKTGKLDASRRSGATNANIAEILNQTTMMLGHEIFDPEVSRRVLVDHAFIACGGEITKAARNWLGNRLDTARRSQVMFMDRDYILNLHVVTNTPLPAATLPHDPQPDADIPF